MTKGTRVEYRRGDLVEWFENEAGGLEQGFTLTRRPGIAQNGESLVIALHLDGALQPSLSPDGDAVLLGSALRYAGLHAWDTSRRAMPSRLEVREQEIRLVIDDRDAAYPLVVDPTWGQQQELTGLTQFESFGYSVAVDGDTAVIGAPGKTIGQNSMQGSAYVFIRSGSPPVWTLQQELTAADGAQHNNFGNYVSVSGDTVVVGAYGVGTVDGNGKGKGSAYVFVRSGSAPVWALQQKLTASDAMAGDRFGISVSVNGNTVVVGAPQLAFSDGITPTPPDGKVYVFVRGATTLPWTQQQELTIAGAPGLRRSVAVNGETFLAGAGWFTGIIHGVLSKDNATYVFVRGAITPPWTLQQKLIAVDAPTFGPSVALSGDTAVIGAPGYRQVFSSPPAPGSAYVYVRETTSPPWRLQQKLTPSENPVPDEFGTAVALSGNIAVVSEGIQPSANAAYVFGRIGTSWSQQQEFMGVSSVAVSGNTVLVGSSSQPVGNITPGAAYVFISDPQVVSVTPNTGSGPGPQTFTAVYSDTDGALDLEVVYFDIATSPGAASSCLAAYVQGTNSLYLFNSTNSAILGPITPGSNTSVSNSQCTLSGVGGLVTSAGTTLTVPFSITFTAGFSGVKNIYGLAQSYNGNSTNWQLLGNWTVGMAGPPPSPPNAASVTPNRGTGLTQTFTVTYTDPAGATDIQVVYFQVGLAGGGAYSCFAAYIQGK